jgi:heme/copper-type cytochrome/quinol oxidase subunit 1
MPRRIYAYPAGLGFEMFNVMATAGAFLLAFSILVFMYNMWVSARRGVPAPADPWGGATLEWTIPSPPQEWNFTDEPVVAERDPVWGMKRAAGVRTLPEPTLSSGKGIHMPGPSWWPLIVSIGILIFFIGFMVKKSWAFPFGPITIAGFLLTTIGIFKWAYEAPDANAPKH